MRRRTLEPFTLGLVALSAAWTLGAKWLNLTYLEAGALTYRLLWEGAYQRLFTATLLHHHGFHCLHLIVNAFSLYAVGRVIERGCGPKVLLGFVFGGAFAGFAASVVGHPDPAMGRMGISGGICALLGLLLAVEWAVSKSFLQFVRQRNTIVILLFVGLSYPLALWLEARDPGFQVDHFGHGGGLAFGLLTGFALYSRRGLRRRLGVVTGILLAVLPVAYASHPFLDPGYRYWRGLRAYRAGDLDVAASHCERALKLDPASAWAGEARQVLVDIYLRRAAEQPSQPEAQALVAKARALGAPNPGPWLRFAEAAERAGRPDDAYPAWREAAGLFPRSEAWRPLARALRLLVARNPPVPELLTVAQGAVRGLASDLGVQEKAALEQAVASAARLAAERTAKEGTAAQGTARELAALFNTLAENAADDTRKPGYRLASAQWLWKGTEPEVTDEARARFRATITEGALHGDPTARAAAEAWFRERGLPVPEPDLEGEEGGG